ncbi:ImmA/IrrE family metallo-endopeptidase [Amycolatopsis sp. RTGN1]|uniref:ImmA/IrrE family metallo-endopeptidase n=1 Tax=Amycolatopsis ponsaeliensis TaxID=2992142 RepID=UPI00254E69B9|nr:ImmA/IrrE family metallo-endopeptidase [Amycolatopsis sp. RTGN1]
MAYYRGFKAEAERLALTMRKELGLTAYPRLDPYRLAEHLSISVRPLTSLQNQGSEIVSAIRVLHGPEASSFSAVTVFRGTERVVVHNEAHPPGRQASNITHELSHGLLLHPAAPVLDGRGCRNWNPDAEDEANFLAGALLVPSKAAWWIAKQGRPFEQAAEDYGCSVDMVRWRVNVTGARRLLAG